jgi:hypothetical protein
MITNYGRTVEEFNQQNCKLLTTKEEYDEILKLAKHGNYKLNYIASCGHEHVVFYNVFKSRGTGIICPGCKNKEIAGNTKKKMMNNEISKTYNLEMEFRFIKKISELLKDHVEIIKAFDGCNVDVIFRPKNIIDDNWVGIQIKTNNTIHLTYSFHMNNVYKNCLILLYCNEDESMWLIPENIIIDQKKISIGYTKSKYNIYKVSKDNIVSKLNELYEKTSKFPFDKLNTPTNFYQQREKEFRKYREDKINFIKFDYYYMEGTVFDFKIENYNVQEKVAKIDNKNKCTFELSKNNGSTNGIRNKSQYDIGDNDYYWLNCDNKKIFFVIPENILIDKGFIGNKNGKKQKYFKVEIKETLTKKNKWLQTYMFNYENIDKDKLLNLLNLEMNLEMSLETSLENLKI